jgi:type IV pilus assembly protein PilA
MSIASNLTGYAMHAQQITERRTDSMKNEQGFSLIELLIVVAIIAIIAAIAVPSLLTARKAANESAAIQGCRTIGSAEIAYAATNNQQYDILGTLISKNFLDGRFTNGIDGYTYADAEVVANGAPVTSYPATTAGSTDFGVVATPNTNMGRFQFGIGTDQVVRYEGTTVPSGVTAGDGIGQNAGSSSSSSSSSSSGS